MVELTTIVQTGIGTVAGVGLSLTDSWQALIGDRIAAWRLTNAAKYQSKIAAELDKAGVKLAAARVPDRYVFSWFEEATKHDEDEIQDLFAKLLAQAAAGNDAAQDRRLIDIVGKLTPPDALAFKTIYDDFNWLFYRASNGRHSASWNPSRLRYIIKPGGGDIIIDKTIEHLVNIGLISQTFDLDNRAISSAISYAYRTNREPDIRRIEIKEKLNSTAIGISLYLALFPMDLTWPAPGS